MLLLVVVVLSICPHGVDSWHDGDAGANVALPFFSEIDIGIERNDHVGEIGIEFTAVKNFIISALGRRLYSGGALQTTARVTLWDVATQAALIYIDVGPSSEVEGVYAFEPITPLEVTGGKDYRLSQQCLNGMADKWNDDSITTAEVDSLTAKQYATFVGSCHKNGNGYPLAFDGARRRAGMVNFKIAIGCPVPTGIANAALHPCGDGANGTHVGDGGTCIATCMTGYSPSVEYLSCSSGVMSPSTFTCSASPCANLTGIEHAAAQSCAEGLVILSGGVCTSQCEQGYTPSVAQLNCSFGELTPSMFTCIPNPCLMPSDIANAASPPCLEGSMISSGSNCSTLCNIGYTPSVDVLDCSAGELDPGNFTCLQKTCLAPVDVDHGTSPSCLQGEIIGSPGVCMAQCGDGYRPSVPLLRCFLGELDPQNFTCQPRPCTVSSLIDKAGAPPCVEGSTVLSGSNCTTQCQQGYTPSLAVLMCSLGTLEPENFTCSPSLCTAPTGISFAQSESCSEGAVLNSGSICTTNCMQGYTASVALLNCEFGQLTPPNFTCTPSPCTAPSGVENTAASHCLEGSAVASGEQCTTKCMAGYTPSSAALNCSFGVLSPQNFSCEPNSCNEPHDSACVGGSSIQSGDACHGQCPQGYYPSPPSLSCALGELTPSNFSCLPLPCSVPAIQNATASSPCIEGATIQSGGICTASCDPGFLSTVMELNCSLGVLTPERFECLPLPCAAPAGVEHGAIQACSEGQVIASGSLCTALCEPGYSPSEPFLNCIASVLSPANFTCSPSPCVAPTVKGADAGSCSEGSTVSSGSTCSAQCSTGYTPSVPSLSCSMGSLTPAAFVCLGDPCPIPTGIQFAVEPLCAQVANSSHIMHGDVCTPQCVNGYSPSASLLNCTAGALSPSTFVCEPSPCVQPSGIIGVREVSGQEMPCTENTISHGGACTTQCGDGYSASVELLNCSFGELLPPNFTCSGHPCLIPNGTANAETPPCAESVNSTYISHGSSCTLQCMPGYSPTIPVLHCVAGSFVADNFTCLPSPCAAPEGIQNAATLACAQGEFAQHGETCTPRCQVGFRPSLASLSCSFGELTPLSFSCIPFSCSAPSGILHAAPTTCSEGAVIDSGGVCTAQCALGYTPSTTFLNCSLGVLMPASFSCLGDDCRVPSGVANLGAQPCAAQNGTEIPHGEICYPQCEPEYLPSVQYLECNGGAFLPASLECYHCFNVAAMVTETDTGSGGVVWPSEGKAYEATPADHWCHYKCGAMLVSYSSTRGMRWVAQALFSHAHCVEFAPWQPNSVMARIDVLVATPADFHSLPNSTLVNNSFRGVVLLVDMSCGEDRPPALQCWQSRTLYVGADRVAGLRHSGAFLEVPPGALHLLARHGDSLVSGAPLAVPLAKLRAPQRGLPAHGKKTKLLAYISDNCSPAAERFFDLAVDALRGMGVVEALGRCHGSHPETMSVECGGPCEAARQNATAALEPFRFALAFEDSAESVDRCPQHVGGMVMDAMLAGAVPVYRGPDEALSILDRNALVFVAPWRPLEEGLAKFRATVLDVQLTHAMTSAGALHAAAAYRWFTWDEALFGQRNKLAADAVTLLQPLLAGAPHWRCAEHALARTPACKSEDSASPPKSMSA